MFLQEQRKRYFKGRKWGKLREAPISLVNANSMHISYGKGAMVFNTLAHFVGEDSLNRVLGDFLQAHKNAYPPYPTSLDLVEMLKTELPDSLQNLIADLFERVILYDNKLGNVKSEKQADGKFAVKVDFSITKKEIKDGKETETAIDDFVEIGFYGENGKLFHVERVRTSEKENSLEISLNQKPAKVVLDPNLLMIDVELEDNGEEG